MTELLFTSEETNFTAIHISIAKWSLSYALKFQHLLSDYIAVCLLPNFRLITVNKEVIVINNFIVGSSIICGSWNDKHRETFK